MSYRLEIRLLSKRDYEGQPGIEFLLLEDTEDYLLENASVFLSAKDLKDLLEEV